MALPSEVGPNNCNAKGDGGAFFTGERRDKKVIIDTLCGVKASLRVGGVLREAREQQG